ncbi:unnamed protein product, partial [Rotaria sp. Silwood1]
MNQLQVVESAIRANIPVPHDDDDDEVVVSFELLFNEAESASFTGFGADS